MADKKALAAKRLKEREQASKKRFKLPEGETTFRVLPNKAGDKESEYYEYAMHSNVGPRKGYIRCGKSLKGKGECWLCDEMLPKLAGSGKGSKKKAAEDMGRKECFAVQIATKNDEDWAGPFLWEMPMSVANKLLGVMSRRNIADPEKGFNITISRTGTGRMDTRYGDLDRDDEQSEAPEDILSRLKDFSTLIKEYDEEAMKAAYYGHEQDEEEEEESKKKKGEDEEDEDEEPKGKRKKEEDEDEDEVEDEKPKKKKKDEEEDEVEEDEDEKPKKKKLEVEEDDDENSEDDDSDVAEALDEEDEEDEKPKKKKPVEEDEDEDEEETSADEDEKRSLKRRLKK